MSNDLRQKLLEWRALEATSTTPRSPDRGAALAPADAQSQIERDWKQKVHELLLKTADLTSLQHEVESRARMQIREMAQKLMDEAGAPLSAVARQRVAVQIEDEILGLGPLEPLLADPSVADILVNGYNSVYVERHGKLEPTDVRFRDDAHLMNIIERIVGRVGRRIDESSPMVDARLADGSRVNAIVPPLALDGPLMSIRRFTVRRLDMQQLIEFGMLTPWMAEFLSAIVRARLNVLISGGTGSGKTTTLNVLSSMIGHQERILTIEDSAELQLQQPHVCRLETRPPNIEGAGEVTQRDLVRNALRMRPDRIVVGEVRGPEALDMLQAMNTGHDGSLTTIHANTPRDALSRIENMVAMSGFELPANTVRAQIASAIQVVLQIERMEDGQRRIVSISEIQGMEGPIVTMAEIFRFRRTGIDADGNVQGLFEGRGIVPKFQARLEQRGQKFDTRMYNASSK